MAKRDLIELLQGQIDAVEAGCEVPAGATPRNCGAGDDGEGETSGAGMLGGRGGSGAEGAEGAFKKIVALVNVSDRSERAVRERLGRCGFAPDAIDEAVGRAASYGFIDDMRFAETLVRSRLAQGKGILGIERELKGHGILLDAVPGWPEDFGADEEAEVERAMACLDRRPPRSKNQRDGAYRKLVGRGYSPSVASVAARSWCDAL